MRPAIAVTDKIWNCFM